MTRGWAKQPLSLSPTPSGGVICGETSHQRREELFEQMRQGEQQAVIISRVGDKGIDLPDAELCVIASTLGGSRTQTAQRIGRTMRPVGAAHGILIATRGSNEEDFIRESSQYLSEKGIDITEKQTK